MYMYVAYRALTNTDLTQLKIDNSLKYLRAGSLHVRTSEEEGRGRGKADSQLLFTRNGTLNTVAELFGGDATRVVDVLKELKRLLMLSLQAE